MNFGYVPLATAYRDSRGRKSVQIIKVNIPTGFTVHNESWNRLYNYARIFRGNSPLTSVAHRRDKDASYERSCGVNAWYETCPLGPRHSVCEETRVLANQFCACKKEMHEDHWWAKSENYCQLHDFIVANDLDSNLVLLTTGCISRPHNVTENSLAGVSEYLVSSIQKLANPYTWENRKEEIILTIVPTKLKKGRRKTDSSYLLLTLRCHYENSPQPELAFKSCYVGAYYSHIDLGL